MSDDSAEPQAAPENRSAPQPIVLLGVVIGLLLAAVACLTIAWIRLSNSPLPGDDPAALLRRVSAVVAVAAGIVVGYLWLGKRYRRASDRLSRFLAATSAVPAAVAVGALVSLYRATPARLFSDVVVAEHRFGGPVVTSAAREAWWLAALAVIATTLTAAIGYLGPTSLVEDEGGWTTRRAAWTGFTAVVTVAFLVVPLLNSQSPPAKLSAAQSIPREIGGAEPTTALTVPSAIAGQVIYRVDNIPADAFVTGGGAGFVAVIDDESSGLTHVNGYDGATGKQRWSYQLAQSKIASSIVSGTGPNSVVVVIASAAISGIDATTGKQLWSRDIVPGQSPYVHVSSRVALIEQNDTQGPVRSMSWTALEIRTGEQLWTQNSPDTCGASWLLTDTAVVAPACDPQQPDIAAQLLDPVTGQALAQIRLSALGIDAVDLHHNGGDVRFEGAMGSSATVEIDRIHPARTKTLMAVDLQAGRLLATLPTEAIGYFLNPTTLAVFVRTDAQILDLQSQTTVSTGLVTRGTGDWGIRPQIVSVGPGWVTSLSTPEEANKKPGEPSISQLRAIGPSGAQRVLPPPCPPDQSPALASLAPGALLVRCGNQVVGIR